MPAIVTAAAPVRHAAFGFYGKIPARGDFVHAALPRGFVEAWDGWLRNMLAASRALLGARWLPAWLEAPVWRFALAPGVCGPDAVLGLWMPSVDRAGRQFPLTLAAVAIGGGLSDLIRDRSGFLAAAEEAGREAVATDLAPDELARRIAAASDMPPDDPGMPLDLDRPDRASWWTAGGPRVASGGFGGDRLPDQDGFTTMLDANWKPDR